MTAGTVQSLAIAVVGLGAPLLLGAAALRGRVGSVGPATYLTLAFASGAALLSASGVALLGVTAVVGSAPPFLPTTFVLAGVAAFVRRPGDALLPERREAFRGIGLVLAAAIVLSIAAELLGARLATADSFVQMLSAHALAQNAPTALLASPLTFYSFPPGMKVLHTPAAALGAAAAYSLSVAAFAGVTALLAVLTQHQNVSALGARRSWLTALLPVALTVSSPQMVTMGRYVNSHMLVALWLLVLVAALLASEQPEWFPRRLSVPLPAQLAIVGIVLARVEGLLLVALVLVAFSPSGRSEQLLRRLWFTLAAVSGGWYALAAFVYMSAGQRPPGALLVSPVLVLLFTLAPWLSCRLPERAGPRSLVAAGLLAGVAGYAASESDAFLYSVSSTWANITTAGGWGISFAVVLAAAGLALLHSRQLLDPALLRIWYIVAFFVPLSMVAAWLRDGPYRVGQGDSLNRMLVHVFPLLVLLAVSWRSTHAAPVPARARAPHGSPQ